MLETQVNLWDEEIPTAHKGQKRPWIDFTPPDAENIHQVLSYGGGRQTFAMLVLVEQGRLPKPELVIFADPGNENPQTYWHIENIAKPLVARLGIEFLTVRREINGDNRDIYQYHWDNHITPIWPTCTSEFKLRPISRELRRRYDITPGLHSVDSWIGITTDEDHRTTQPTVAYIRKDFPFLGMGLSLDDCIQLTIDAGYPVPPKSGCEICCHKDWEYEYTANPARFNQALELEKHAAEKRPETRLPEHGRGLRMIVLQPKFRELEYTENCAAGYCNV